MHTNSQPHVCGLESKHCFCQDHSSVVKAIFTESGFVESTTTTEDIGIILESSSFYAEQGGQVLLYEHFMYAFAFTDLIPV
jgi:hypothetical protein